jgi:hypothetical protein
MARIACIVKIPVFGNLTAHDQFALVGTAHGEHEWVLDLAGAELRFGR